MKNYRILFLSIFGGIALFLLFFCVGILWFGGVGPLIAYINGQSVHLMPRLLDLGSQEPDAETVAVFRLHNLSSKEISVVGERSSCNCAFSEQIPIVAAPGKSADLKINVHLPKYDFSYDQTITFMVAEPNRLAMHPVRITATIPNPLIQPVEGPAPAMTPPEPTEDQPQDE